jgi:predicted aldo/keto reductase-like oxidoreductase
MQNNLCSNTAWKIKRWHPISHLWSTYSCSLQVIIFAFAWTLEPPRVTRITWGSQLQQHVSSKLFRLLSQSCFIKDELLAIYFAAKKFARPWLVLDTINSINPTWNGSKNKSDMTLPNIWQQTADNHLDLVHTSPCSNSTDIIVQIHVL